MLSKNFKKAMTIAYKTTMLATKNEEFNELITDWDYDREYYVYVGTVINTTTDYTDDILIECAKYVSDDETRFPQYIMIENDDIEHGLIFGSVVGYDEEYAELAETIWDYDGNRKYYKFEYYSELCRFLEEHRWSDYGDIVNMADCYNGEYR